MALVLFTAGCMGDERPRPATGAAREVAQVVSRLEHATARRDFQTVCNELFTRQARERAGGDGCERLTRSAAEGIARPRLELTRIDVKGSRATVRVITRAAGQAAVPVSLTLFREDGGWRIEAVE